MVREKSGKSQGILLYSNCGHPDLVSCYKIKNLDLSYEMFRVLGYNSR